jgi:hypothetical protein
VSVTDRPDWLPAHFVDGPALLDSYREAQRSLTQVMQERADLRQSLALVESENAVLHELVGRLYAEREVLGVQEALSSQAQRLLDAMEPNGKAPLL